MLKQKIIFFLFQMENNANIEIILIHEAIKKETPNDNKNLIQEANFKQ